MRPRSLPRLVVLLAVVACGSGGPAAPAPTGSNSPPSSTPTTPTPTPTPAPTGPLAERYPGDANIASDPDVLFTEMADEASLAELFARWSANSTANSIALDPSTFAPGSPGRQSLRLFTTAGQGGPGTVRTAMLYKHFPSGFTGTVFARWYVKYNTVGTFHHSGPRLGGNNPLSATSPNSPAGVKPTGADFFYLGAETSQAKTSPALRSNFDFYNYWMHQRGTTFFPGQFFGNSFVNSSAVSIDLSAWTCIEVQLTLNEPVTSFNGEIALWINGVEMARVKQGTVGTFTEDNFSPSASGSPFEGFQWRNTASLPINYFQLLHFVDNDPTGLMNSVNYDHIVLARKYIGPMK
ncbi:MAG: hypothetical protein P3A28_05635 [Gemmatimonadota bacterium]|nr:hypothetical protein [Gemmatimonadota bacterium]